jgi:hypothetical protein
VSKRILETRWELRSAFGVAALHRDDALERRDQLRELGVDAGVFRVRRSAVKLRRIGKAWSHDGGLLWWVTSPLCSAEVLQDEQAFVWRLDGWTDHAHFVVSGHSPCLRGAIDDTRDEARRFGYALPLAPKRSREPLPRRRPTARAG